MSRKTIFSKEGYFVGDLRAATVRSWTLPSQGVIGQCEWDMSTLDRKTNANFLKYGKYLLVRQRGLPDWIGVIYKPQPWDDENGKVTMRAYQCEKILEWRITPIQTIKGTPGSCFTQILDITNRIELNEKPIFPKRIDDGGNAVSEDLGDHAYAHIQKIAETNGNDFDVQHAFDANGRLYLQGNWYQRKGIETNQYFREGHNIQRASDILSSQGELFNDYTGYSDASTASSRLKSRAMDVNSIGDIGLYQTSIIFSGVTEQSTLDRRVLTELSKTIISDKELNLVALNVGKTYDYLDIGNIWNLDLNRVDFRGNGYGLNAKARILGMEADDLNENMVKLVAEVQNG